MSEHEYTSTIGVQQPTLDEMLNSVEEMLKRPRPIGSLMGEVVYLDSWNRTLRFGAVSCSVDHPYLNGTRIQAAALEAMGDEPRGLSASEGPSSPEAVTS